jgi:hypothetical protein
VTTTFTRRGIRRRPISCTGWFQVRYGYKKNPFEVEANQRENDPLTEDEVRWREQGVVEL